MWVLLILLVFTGSCRRRHEGVLRIGFLPNVTHAVPMVADARGTIRDGVHMPVQFVPFNAGPAIVEALLAGDLDAGYAGPGPAINAFIRTKGRIRVVSGVAGGGAAFVVRSDLEIDEPADLSRRRVATPQIGNTQDIALRQYLWEHDLAPSDRGGTVEVYPLTNADILALMRSREIDGAWVAEPWVSRLVDEAHGRVFVDETTLWDGGRHPTTLLMVNGDLLEKHPETVQALVKANHDTIAWVRGNPLEAQARVNEQLERHTGKKLRKEILASAWKRITFTEDPMPDALREVARAARRIGYLPRSDIRGMIVTRAELDASVRRVQLLREMKGEATPTPAPKITAPPAATPAAAAKPAATPPAPKKKKKKRT